MNKYQEALKVAYEMMNAADFGSAKIGCEALKTLQELVDKETPKRVKDLSNGYRLQVECPSCDETLINENECIDNEFHNRCHECGQKLDWR